MVSWSEVVPWLRNLEMLPSPWYPEMFYPPMVMPEVASGVFTLSSIFSDWSMFNTRFLELARLIVVVAAPPTIAI